jgi:phospholipase A2-like protein
LQKRLVTALVAVCATAGAAAPATAMAGAPEPTVASVQLAAPVNRVPDDGAACKPACAARAVTLERVYGPLYGRYKAMYPNALNWNNDGCSFPSWMYDIRGLGSVISHYRGEFQKSCDRHDFGYRNHEKSGVGRHAVDLRFRDNMYHQCDVNHIDGLPVWVACRGAAKLIFEVVDSFGGRFW